MGGAGNLPPQRPGEGRGGGLLERILLAMAVGLLCLGFADSFRPILRELTRGVSLLWAEYAIVLLTPIALLLPAVIRPRSIGAAVVAALPVGFLVMLGEAFTPMSWQRFAIHIAAILILAALVIQVIRDVGDRRFRVLWIVAGLLVSLRSDTLRRD
jgi:hypothetical protein